jgi:hypothetical protein
LKFYCKIKYNDLGFYNCDDLINNIKQYLFNVDFNNYELYEFNCRTFVDLILTHISIKYIEKTNKVLKYYNCSYHGYIKGSKEELTINLICNIPQKLVCILNRQISKTQTQRRIYDKIGNIEIIKSFNYTMIS